MNLTTGRSQELAERILKGDLCDVFTPSAPAVIEKDLMTKKVAGTDRIGASWSVIFSANEMVLITAKGNPLGIKKMSDLAKPGIRFTRVTGEKDMATQRTIDFVKNVTALEGNPQLAQGIIGGAVTDPAKPHTVPETIRDIATGKADAGVVYYSAAVEAKKTWTACDFPPRSTSAARSATPPLSRHGKGAGYGDLIRPVHSLRRGPHDPRSDRPTPHRSSHHHGRNPTGTKVRTIRVCRPDRDGRLFIRNA